ncbi:hypothetical protein B0O80DRAFT_448966 [Mortierella sp. GBAus27b]|nr:hypothetical protein BGX31_009214 [Mortierella sp. GBA43]KAI8355302.1 hypothetical protein B0O80DRAFT_448966 [Mortierella sp. GBAus27b]
MAIEFDHAFSKIANIIVYLTLLSGTIYSTFGSDSDSEHQSYITPAPFTFYIWTIVHFLLGGMVVYQWFTDKVHEAVGWHFVTASIFNAIWLALWTSGHTFWSLFPMFLATGAVSHIYYSLKQASDPDSDDSLLCKIFLHLPFSLYHAWIFVLMILNLVTALAPVTADGPSFWVIVGSIAGLAFIASTVIGYIEYKQGDVAGALVLAWYLFGVFEQQQEAAIHWTALGLAIVVAIYTLKPLVFRLIGRQSAETAPLLG